MYELVSEGNAETDGSEEEEEEGRENSTTDDEAEEEEDEELDQHRAIIEDIRCVPDEKSFAFHLLLKVLRYHITN